MLCALAAEFGIYRVVDVFLKQRIIPVQDWHSCHSFFLCVRDIDRTCIRTYQVRIAVPQRCKRAGDASFELLPFVLLFEAEDNP